MVDRAGQISKQLTEDESKSIFEFVSEGGSHEAARARLPSRNRTTVNRAYNVAAEFRRRALSSLDDATAEEIAAAAMYSTTRHYVQRLFLSWQAWIDNPDSEDRQSRHKGQQQIGMDLLGALLIKTPSLTHARGLPASSAYNYYWVIKTRLESLSDQVISVGDFVLEVRRADVVHVLPHIGNQTYGSRSGVPAAHEALESHVGLTPEKPVIIGALRFMDDIPFSPGPVNVKLLVKGTGPFRGSGKSQDLGCHEHR